MNERPGQVAAVFSVGKTEGGCEFALRWILNEAKQTPHLHFFFGQAVAGQDESPLSAVHRLLTNPEFAHLPRGGECATDAFSLDRAYADAIKYVREIEAKGFDRVYVGITGGANPMVAALFHAAMSELTCEVVPIYVQSKASPQGTQDSIGLITGLRTRDSILIERVLRLARQGQLAAANAIAQSLPAKGRTGFVRRAILAFARWDNFEYEVAKEIAELASRCDDFTADPLLEPLVGTVERYGKIAHHVAEMEATIKNPEAFAQACQDKSWEHKVKNRAFWLPLDAMSNGWRRLDEGRSTDAVLRAYRAVEIAVHCRLFSLRVHPSGLDWDRSPLKEIADRWPPSLEPRPKVVALEHAIALLGLLTDEDFRDTEASRQKIQSCRNYTYLEHGYQRVGINTGRTILLLADELVNRILWVPRIEESRRLRMVF